MAVQSQTDPVTGPMAAARVVVTGRVQGVGYRFFAQATAETRGLKGWTRNLPNGAVECEVEGPRAVIEQWVKELGEGPPLARVEAVQVSWMPPTGKYPEFTIRG